MGLSAPEPRIVGRYMLHGELASGGMATVHLGRLRGEAGFARTIAIKRLHPQFAKDPEFVGMFMDEARLAARVRHPNVVPTIDVVRQADEIFLVMEYVAGETLSRLIRALHARKERMPPRIAATIVAGVSHGLHAAHEAKSESGEPLGIVHRDVSPQNVMVGVDGIAHVLDFGVAKAAGRVQTTREGQVKGKIAYMAPEQLAGDLATRQSDVYAAGVVLWEALCQKRLYDGENEAITLVRVLEGKVVAPSKLVPDVPPALDDVVMRALSKDPAKRYATAKDLAMALERCIVIAPPSEVAAWVDKISGDEMAKRARRVADIERRGADAPSSVSDVMEIVPSESLSGIRVGDPTSQVSTISVSKSEHVFDSPRRRGKKRWVAVATIGVVSIAALTVAMVLGFRWGAARTSVIVAVAPPPVVAPAAAPPPESVAAPAPANTGMSAISSATAAPLPAPKPTPARPTNKAKGGDCDPPFTRDAAGHKHYKLQCL